MEDLKQFTCAATHDLREPLRTIGMYIHLLKRKLSVHVDEHTNLCMSQISNAAERMSCLIDGLLQFYSMAEAEAIQVSTVDTEAALRDALDDLQVAISESKTELRYGPLPPVRAEHSHVHQLFQNLVGNAIKYAGPNLPPRICITARREGASCIFAIQDWGIGIPPEYQEQIFLPFKRLHGQDVSGAGIGLATCQRIVERYGGRIWVESQGAQGSTFYFTLPEAYAGPSSRQDRHDDVSMIVEREQL